MRVSHCPFCQQLLYEKMRSTLHVWKCPDNHYEWLDLSLVDEGRFQEKIIYGNEFMLVMNYPHDDEFAIIFLNVKKIPGQITVYESTYVKPFIIPYDYKALKQRIETMVSFK